MKDKVDKNWGGYTLDELRYRIVVNRVSLNVEKQRLTEIGQMITTNPFGVIGGNSLIGYLEKIMSALNYFDVAMKVIRRIREILNSQKSS